MESGKKMVIVNKDMREKEEKGMVKVLLEMKGKKRRIKVKKSEKGD